MLPVRKIYSNYFVDTPDQWTRRKINFTRKDMLALDQDP